jgi:hypothetical protein
MTSRPKIYVINQLEVCGFFADCPRNNHSDRAPRLNTVIRYADFAIFMNGGVVYAAGPIREIPKS